MAAEDEKAELIRILREDRYLTHSKSTDERLARLEEKLSPKGGTSDDPSGGKTDPPPVKDPPNDPEKKTKKSLWWGDRV